MYVRTYVRTYVHTYIHTYIHTHTYILIHTNYDSYIHTYSYIQIMIHTYIHTHTYILIHTYYDYIYTVAPLSTCAQTPPASVNSACHSAGNCLIVTLDGRHFSWTVSLSLHLQRQQKKTERGSQVFDVL